MPPLTSRGSDRSFVRTVIPPPVTPAGGDVASEWQASRQTRVANPCF